MSSFFQCVPPMTHLPRDVGPVSFVYSRGHSSLEAGFTSVTLSHSTFLTESLKRYIQYRHTLIRCLIHIMSYYTVASLHFRMWGMNSYPGLNGRGLDSVDSGLSKIPHLPSTVSHYVPNWREALASRFKTSMSLTGEKR